MYVLHTLVMCKFYRLLKVPYGTAGKLQNLFKWSCLFIILIASLSVMQNLESPDQLLQLHFT